MYAHVNVPSMWCGLADFQWPRRSPAESSRTYAGLGSTKSRRSLSGFSRGTQEHHRGVSPALSGRRKRGSGGALDHTPETMNALVSSQQIVFSGKTPFVVRSLLEKLSGQIRVMERLAALSDEHVGNMGSVLEGEALPGRPS